MSGGPIQRRETVVPAPLGRAKGRAERMGEQTREFLAFALAGERFALPLASVREILKLSPITEVPRAPRDVLGILSVRGRITTVIDLRRRLRLPHGEVTRGARVLLVDAGVEVLGLLVDEVFQVYRLSPDEIELAAVVAGDLSDYVYGIGRPGAVERGAAADEIMILLDPVPLLRR
ncbi:MAG: purine-binding chemotaxis protein CheW [Sandaracinaceae bacterium]|nr:purine-binding chemotaxis protein CheW [Sandaracinaceae bacterium]